MPRSLSAFSTGRPEEPAPITQTFGNCWAIRIHLDRNRHAAAANDAFAGRHVFGGEYHRAISLGARMKRIALLIALASCTWLAWAAESGRFLGKVVVEWLDDDPFIPGMRLAEDFGYVDGAGKTWLAPKSVVVDGRALPLIFRDGFGGPFVGQYRKTSVLYDHYCRTMSEPWKDVHRMFYHAAVSEGVDDAEAKLMYMTLYAGGLRWEMKGSTCYTHCHVSASALTWKPDLQTVDLKSVAGWIRQSSPSLDEIDARLNEVIKRP